MKFETPLISGTLVRRYKRFLADVVLKEGDETTVHTPNTGAMLGCQTPGSRVWLLRSDNPKRKYPLSWELVEANPGTLVGINTGRSNQLVGEALAAGVIKSMVGYQDIRREVTVPDGKSRIDFFLSGHPKKPDCFLEVKNVTAAVQGKTALFPDAVSTRATKHLNTLASLVQEGFAAALCFCVQRDDVSYVRPAWEIDPTYAETLSRVADQGVKIFAYGATVTPRSISLDRRLRVRLR